MQEIEFLEFIGGSNVTHAHVLKLFHLHAFYLSVYGMHLYVTCRDNIH